jgi:hypothetical protein
MQALQAKSDDGESIYDMLRERVSVERAGRTQFGWRMSKGPRKNCGGLRRVLFN